MRLGNPAWGVICLIVAAMAKRIAIYARCSTQTRNQSASWRCH